MQDNLFEYAIIRVVPQVEREEFLNVGVILFCAKFKFLQCRFSIDEERLCSFSNRLDVGELKDHINAITEICCGNEHGGSIAKLDMASRFRWLTATRSTVVQSSKVHPGLCDDPAVTLEKLYSQMVL